MSLVSYSARRPVATIAATLAIVLLGTVSLGRLPVSLLPDVSLPVLTIRTLYTGAAAEEVSRFVAEPVEEAIAATPGLVELRSVSRNGEAMTTARFAWGTDMQATVLNVRERLDNAREPAARARRPADAAHERPGRASHRGARAHRPGRPALARARGRGRPCAAARADRRASRASRSSGAPEDEIRIEVDADRMRALGLTTDDVATAVKAANANGAGGTIRRGQFRFSVRALTEFRSVDEIGLTRRSGRRGAASSCATSRRSR